MPALLVAAILGLIEGFTEFLPISSTGHLFIAEHWLGSQSELFNVVIQPAAALALIPLFWSKLRGLVFGLGQPANRDLLLKLGVAFAITASALLLRKVGILSHEPDVKDEAWKLARLTHVAWATLIGGFVILAVEWWSKGKTMSNEVTWPIVIAFGIAQLIAVAFPGASRSGTTIMLAMWFGLARPAATEFSFLLGIPTLFAAGGKELWDEFKKHSGSTDWTALGIGSLASFISAFLVVRWLIGYVRGHTFNGFALYRIALGATLLFWVTKA